MPRKSTSATAKQVTVKPSKKVAGLGAPSRKGPATEIPESSEGSFAEASSADQVDEQLARYRAMRDFGRTAEPSGAAGLGAADPPVRSAKHPAKAAKRTTLSGGLPFVIQKHAASHLHYDFRLGWAGVLKSWACAKGPSYVTGDRRLAVQVEDHPIEYGGFEGTIPKGQYGGGTVMVWDQGTWWPQAGHENVDAGLRDGSLKFEMNGTRMKGKWTLVRMNSRPQEKGGRWGSSSKPNWLLIKEHDSFERHAGDPAITDEALTSAVTGRTMEQIAQETDHVWNSKETAGSGQAWYRNEQVVSPGEKRAKASSQTSNASVRSAVSEKKASRASEAPTLPVSSPSSGTSATSPDSENEEPESSAILSPAGLEALPKEAQPTFIEPQLALEIANPPDTAGWLHELKLDGYRIQARKAGTDVALLTRSGLDWTHRVPAIAAAVARLPVGSVTLDGEVVVLAEDGTTNFARLQASFQDGERNPLTYFCFDLLHLLGRNPRNLSLQKRKVMLAQILSAPASQGDEVRLSEHLDSGGEVVFKRACELGAEGIISKRADAPYSSARNGDWLKSKCLHEQEFVIGGFTLSSDGPDRIGSLLVGYYTEEKLVYAGRSGTGFTQKSRRSLRERLAPLQRKSLPFANVSAEARRGALWVEPQLVGQIRFASWTAEGLLRQAAFLGLREDKAPEEVRREEPSTSLRPKGTGQQRRAVPHATAPASSAAGATPPASRPTKASASGRLEQVSAPSMRLTHPAKIVDPESGLTKQELAAYYWAVAPFMLPHIADRPLSLVRCPEGAGKPCFYQKHVNHMLPPGVSSVNVPDKKTGKIEPYITLSTPEAIAGLAQMGVLEIHPWGSRNEDLEHPDRLTFDLDPDESLSWPALSEAAAEVRARLKKAGLVSFLKTTGGKGLHVVVPIQPELAWPAVKELTHKFVQSLARDHPTRYLTVMTKAARKGKIYLDYLRNERGATAVAPFSPRARLGANVSVPLPWSALKLPTRPVFAARDLAGWRGDLRADPWKTMPGTKQRLIADRVKAL